MQLAAAAVTPPAEHAARRPAGAARAAAADAGVESVEKVIFEEETEKAETYKLYIKNGLQKECFCENDDLGTYSTDSLGLLAIMNGLVNTVLVLLMAASSAGGKSDSCEVESRLDSLATDYGVLVLCAACEIVPRADSVCSAVFRDQYWRTDEPPTLAERTSRARLDSALDWVRSAISSLPADSQCSVLSSLESYAHVASELQGIGGMCGEAALGTAVAFVPAVADLFPRDQKTRAALGGRPGDSLAEAEFTDMKYEVALRLSRMSSREQDDCLRELCAEALKARE